MGYSSYDIINTQKLAELEDRLDALEEDYQTHFDKQMEFNRTVRNFQSREISKRIDLECVTEEILDKHRHNPDGSTFVPELCDRIDCEEQNCDSLDECPPMKPKTGEAVLVARPYYGYTIQQLRDRLHDVEQHRDAWIAGYENYKKENQELREALVEVESTAKNSLKAWRRLHEENRELKGLVDHVDRHEFNDFTVSGALNKAGQYEWNISGKITEYRNYPGTHWYLVAEHDPENIPTLGRSLNDAFKDIVNCPANVVVEEPDYKALYDNMLLEVEKQRKTINKQGKRIQKLKQERE